MKNKQNRLNNYPNKNIFLNMRLLFQDEECSRSFQILLPTLSWNKLSKLFLSIIYIFLIGINTHFALRLIVPTAYFLQLDQIRTTRQRYILEWKLKTDISKFNWSHSNCLITTCGTHNKFEYTSTYNIIFTEQQHICIKQTAKIILFSQHTSIQSKDAMSHFATV